MTKNYLSSNDLTLYLLGNAFNIYLDDVYIRDHSCLPPGDCDFDSGFCKKFNTMLSLILRVT